jgi:hypothetical protein
MRKNLIAVLAACGGMLLTGCSTEAGGTLTGIAAVHGGEIISSDTGVYTSYFTSSDINSALTEALNEMPEVTWLQRKPCSEYECLAAGTATADPSVTVVITITGSSAGAQNVVTVTELAAQ